MSKYDTNFWDVEDVLKLCEKALFIMINANMIKQSKETPYQHGQRKGHDDRKAFDIKVIEMIIEELKKDV